MMSKEARAMFLAGEGGAALEAWKVRRGGRASTPLQPDFRGAGDSGFCHARARKGARRMEYLATPGGTPGAPRLPIDSHKTAWLLLTR
jgi:hypothetical protein